MKRDRYMQYLAGYYEKNLWSEDCVNVVHDNDCEPCFMGNYEPFVAPVEVPAGE